MSEHVREYQRVSNAQATMTWSSGDRIDAQVATDFWEGTGERSIFSYNHTRREYTRVDVEERASVNDEPITAYRRVRTMEGWAPEDDLSTEVTPNAPSAEAPYRSVWVAYNHARREYVSGAPWPREASVQDKEALRRAMALVETVWNKSGEGTTAIADHVEGHGGDANHWSGVMRWVHGAEGESEEHFPGALSRDLQELRAEVAQLHQEVEFWRKGASTWRERALEYWDAGGEKQGEALIERVARWAHAEARSRTSTVPSWDVASPHVRMQWLSQARAAIEGER